MGGGVVGDIAIAQLADEEEDPEWEAVWSAT